MHNRICRPLNSFEPPKWTQTDKSNEAAIDALIWYLKLATSAIELVRYLHINTLDECVSVVKEYRDILYPLVLEMAKHRTQQATKPGISVQGLEEQVCLLESKLTIGPHPVYRRRNLFDVVFTALASKYTLGPDFHVKVNEDELVRTWLRLARRRSLQPSVVHFDVCCNIVGTTVPKWGFCKDLRVWEREIRKATINPQVFAEYKRLRDIITPERQLGLATLSPEDQVGKALVLVNKEGILTKRLSKGHTWQAYRLTDKLKLLDPCPTCRVAHDATFLTPPGKPTACINENWNIEDPCQCAEASVSSQLHDTNQYGISSKERRQLPTRTTVERKMYWLYASVFRHCHFSQNQCSNTLLMNLSIPHSVDIIRRDRYGSYVYPMRLPSYDTATLHLHLHLLRL